MWERRRPTHIRGAGTIGWWWWRRGRSGVLLAAAGCWRALSRYAAPTKPSPAGVPGSAMSTEASAVRQHHGRRSDPARVKQQLPLGAWLWHRQASRLAHGNGQSIRFLPAFPPNFAFHSARPLYAVRIGECTGGDGQGWGQIDPATECSVQGCEVHDQSAGSTCSR